MKLLKRLSVFCLIMVLAACSNAQEPKEAQETMEGGFTVTAFSGEDNSIELSDGEKVEGLSETYIPIFVNGALSSCVTAFSKDAEVYVPEEFVENEMNLDMDAVAASVESMVQEGVTYYNLLQSLETTTDWAYAFVDKNDDDIKGKALLVTHSSVYVYRTKVEEEGISSEEGLEQAKATLNESLDVFSDLLRDNLENSGEDTSRFDGELESIQQDIDGLFTLGETLGYYIYDMNVYRVMVHKYTGQVYVNYESGLATYNRLVDPNGDDIGELFMPLYIVG